MTTTPPTSHTHLDRVAEAGRLLYGERWQSDLARDLNNSVRTIQAWFAAPSASSHRAMPPGVLAEVEALVRARRIDLDEWLSER